GLSSALGNRRKAAQLDRQARRLRDRFEKAFWCEELSCYAEALDGRKRPCRIRTSNAGHALFCGIATHERGLRMAKTLLSPALFPGWGVRTLGSGERRYNPMSYHDGSVWPHDNALLAAGLSRYGFKAEASRLLDGLFEAAMHFEMRRLPELFCGFARRA